MGSYMWRMPVLGGRVGDKISGVIHSLKNFELLEQDETTRVFVSA